MSTKIIEFFLWKNSIKPERKTALNYAGILSPIISSIFMFLKSTCCTLARAPDVYVFALKKQREFGQRDGYKTPQIKNVFHNWQVCLQEDISVICKNKMCSTTALSNNWTSKSGHLIFPFSVKPWFIIRGDIFSFSTVTVLI